MAYTRPDYPAVLTKANWDKNKGLLAKAAGFTGMGNSLTALEAAYKKVDWDKLEIAKTKMSQADFTLAKVNQRAAGAVAEMKGGAAALRVAAFATRDLAKATGESFKKNVLTKSSASLCEKIEKAADFLGVAVNPNSLSGYIQNDVKELRSAYDHTFESLKKTVPEKVKALEEGLKAAGNPPTEASWKKANMMTRCRDLNQLIGNAGKLAEKGYPVGMDLGATKKFFDDMAPYAAKDCPFDDDKKDDAKNAHAKVSGLIARAKALK